MGFVWDLFRAIAFAQMLVIVVLTTLIIRRSWLEARQLKRSWRAALPKHIYQVAAGTLVISVGYGFTSLERIGEGPPPFYGAPLGVIGFTLLILGLWTMLSYQGRSYSTLRDPLAVDDPKSELPNVATIILYIVAMVAVVIGFWRIGQVVEQACEDNNQQDATIARILDISLADSRDPEERVENGLPAQPTPEELEVIERVEAEADALREPADCSE